MNTRALCLPCPDTSTADVRVCIARDGSRLATVRRGPRGLQFPVWTGGVYRARRRLADGVLTWRRVGSVGPSVSGDGPSGRLVAAVRAEAGPRFTERRVRHGDLVS